MWNTVINDGSTDMVPILSGGHYLDQRTLAILTVNNDTMITILEVTQHYTDILDSSVLNYAWTQAGVFLYCYAMSEADCKYPYAARSLIRGCQD